MFDALKEQGYTQVADVLGQWVTRVSGGQELRRRRRLGGLWDRDRFLTPDNTFDKMRLAREAMRDDVIGGAADGTEALAFAGVSMFAENEEDEDFWNQLAGDLNLDDQFRKAWRILYSDSSYVFAVWWDRRTYTVRGTTDKGNQKRKKFEDMIVPVGISFLDTAKVAPVGMIMFGQERLAYVASPLESIRIDQILAKRDQEPTPPRPRYIEDARRKRVWIPEGAVTDAMLDDPLIETIIERRYDPDWYEAQDLLDDGVDVSSLYLLSKNHVFRHTLTRPDFQRFADVRLESLFPELDLKTLLHQMDRAHLVGGVNFIVLITRGTDKNPALPAEIAQLQATAFALASVPIVVGPHDLKVEIITPKIDHTLDRDKYDTIDARLFARAWQTFIPTGAQVEDPLKLGKVIGKGLESRRLMMRRTFEATVIDMTRKMNATKLTSRAKFVFRPATIALSFDASLASFILDLRATNEISRGTVLGQVDLDQDDEYRQRKRERDRYDEVFQTINPNNQGVPQPGNPNEPDPTTPAGQRFAGRRKNRGAGAAPGSGQGQPPRKPRHRSNSDSPIAAEIEEQIERFHTVDADLDEMDKKQLVMWARRLQIPGRARMTADQLRDVLDELLFVDEGDEE